MSHADVSGSGVLFVLFHADISSSVVLVYCLLSHADISGYLVLDLLMVLVEIHCC